MSVKVLKTRRKRASKGSPIRISDEVRGILEKKRQGRISFDELLRRMLGLPDRKGERRAILEGWLEVNSGHFYFDEAEARGASVIAAAKAKTRKVKQPIRMREVV